VPLNFEKDKLGDRVLKKFGLKGRKNDMNKWRKMIERNKKAEKIVKIGMVGKYFATGDFCLKDSYISVIEAVKHACSVNDVVPKFEWIDTKTIEEEGVDVLKYLDGVIVPQGWGTRGSEGKIKTIKYCRENKKPYFGLCYGMQMCVIEFARNVLGYKDANSEEVNKKTKNPVIHIMPDQEKIIKEKGYGGTIRLGGWPCKLKSKTKLFQAYNNLKKDTKVVSERHRHRYEYNNKYREELEKAGLKVCGVSPDEKIVEAVEITKHPFFIGTQFHPEYISRPLDPHPLFVEFIKVCKNK